MIEYQVRLFSRPAGPLDPADPGGPSRGHFNKTSFREFIGHSVLVKGLDPAYEHLLVAVDPTADGMQCVLTIQTREPGNPNLTADLSIRVATPKAQVRAYSSDNPDTLLTTAYLDAPLQLGQLCTVNGDYYTVASITYPYRDPEHPESTEDYQQVTLNRSEQPPVVQGLNLAGPVGPLLGLLG